jgi:zinc transporter 1/2/3
MRPQTFRDPDSLMTRLARSFAAGVIITLALVHIMPEAVEMMADLGGIHYPLGGTCVLFGVVLMVLLEHVAHVFHDSHSHGAGQQQHVQLPVACRHDEPASGKLEVPLVHADDAAGAGNVDLDVNPHSALHRASTESHAHVCVSRGAAGNWVAADAAEADASNSLRLRILAYMFEMGCICHSFIIGLALGVNDKDLKQARALLIALAFHQWLEGISLASVIINGGFSLWKGIAMVMTYSLTCPIGIAIGALMRHQQGSVPRLSRVHTHADAMHAHMYDRPACLTGV